MKVIHTNAICVAVATGVLVLIEVRMLVCLTVAH